MPMTKRHRLAAIINLLVPGAGMIVLRREWLGLSLAVCFTLFTQLAIFGAAIVPYDLPRWVTGLSALGAAAVWISSQILTWRRMRLLSSPINQEEVEELCRRCRELMQRQDWHGAHDLLLVAQRLDDEHVGAAQLRAQVLAELGRSRQAQRWRRRAQRWSSGQAAKDNPSDKDSTGHAPTRLIQ